MKSNFLKHPRYQNMYCRCMVAYVPFTKGIGICNQWTRYKREMEVHFRKGYTWMDVGLLFVLRRVHKDSVRQSLSLSRGGFAGSLFLFSGLGLFGVHYALPFSFSLRSLSSAAFRSWASSSSSLKKRGIGCQFMWHIVSTTQVIHISIFRHLYLIVYILWTFIQICFDCDHICDYPIIVIWCL